MSPALAQTAASDASTTTPSRNSSASYSHEKKERPISPCTTAISEERTEHYDRTEDGVDPDADADADTLDSHYHDRPPPLNYTITRARERYIAIFFMLLFVETGVLPLILFYSLEWGAHLSTTKNLAIITSLVGTVSGLKVTQRTYQLWFKVGHESRRPIGAGRWGVDTTHVLVGCSLCAFFVPLIIGSSLTPASVPTVAMALPILVLCFSIPFLLSGIWDRRIRLPVRISSLPPGEPLPPLTYTLVEDIVAVDGGGGLEFRQAWRHRYEASRVMRHLLRVTSVWWGATGTVVAAGCLAAAWTAPDNTAYGLGYGVPWLWGVIAAVWTFYYVRGELAREYEEWARAEVHREVTLHLREKEADREADRRHLAAARTIPAQHPNPRRSVQEPRRSVQTTRTGRGSMQAAREGASIERTRSEPCAVVRPGLGAEERV